MARLAEQDVTPFQKVSALFAWWGLSNEDVREKLSSRLKRLHTLTSDLQNIYAEAGSEQTEAALATNDRILRSYQDLVQCRRPADVLAAQGALRYAVGRSIASNTGLGGRDPKSSGVLRLRGSRNALDLQRDDANRSTRPKQP